MNKIICSIGICVYNEEKNIGQLLESILRQKLKKVQIDEILLIASGSTDMPNNLDDLPTIFSMSSWL